MTRVTIEITDNVTSTNINVKTGESANATHVERGIAKLVAQGVRNIVTDLKHEVEARA